MKNFMNTVFNWKRHPASVFYIAAPLAILGMVMTFLSALLQYKLGNGFGFLVIWFVGLTLLIIGLIPAWRIYRKTHSTQK